MTARETCEAVRAHLPVRARVAFALSIADRAGFAMASDREASRILNDAIDDGWRWVEGQDVRAIDLYEKHVEGIGIQGSITTEGVSASALFAGTSAFYYLMWHAFDVDVEHGLTSWGEVGNELAEVDEGTLAEVCNFAIESGECDDRIIEALAARLSRDFLTDNSSTLGPPISRFYFGGID